LEIHLPKPTQPQLFQIPSHRFPFFKTKKWKKVVGYFLRLLSPIAAATTTIMTTAAAIAMNVVVGSPLVGGSTAADGNGEAEAVWTGEAGDTGDKGGENDEVGNGLGFTTYAELSVKLDSADEAQ
jgi:hypothetical protein